jgi:hypothetical protein
VPVALLQVVTGLADAALHTDLHHLQAAEFLSETRRLPAPTYTFKQYHLKNPWLKAHL